MKDAYRATSPVGLRDVAILKHKRREDEEDLLRDFRNLGRLKGKPNSEYLSYPENFFLGDDGYTYVAEELLARPLDVLVPLRDGVRFFQVAHDLCRGLQCLHENDLKHSDIKLDNCGLDNQGRAKLFDLSSATSEPGSHIRGSIFTRAPEMFTQGQNYSNAADVWALGATLFALRTGDYPFVPKDEIQERTELGKTLRTAKGAAKKKAQERKAAFDRHVEDRARASDAEEKLFQEILEALPGEPGQYLQRMLSFNDAARPIAKTCAEKWAKVRSDFANQTFRAASDDELDNQRSKMERYVDQLLQNYVTVTDRQWDRLADSFEELKKSSKGHSLDELEAKLDKIKNQRSKGGSGV